MNLKNGSAGRLWEITNHILTRSRVSEELKYVQRNRYPFFPKMTDWRKRWLPHSNNSIFSDSGTFERSPYHLRWNDNNGMRTCISIPTSMVSMRPLTVARIDAHYDKLRYVRSVWVCVCVCLSGRKREHITWQFDVTLLFSASLFKRIRETRERQFNKIILLQSIM